MVPDPTRRLGMATTTTATGGGGGGMQTLKDHPVFGDVHWTSSYFDSSPILKHMDVIQEELVLPISPSLSSTDYFHKWQEAAAASGANSNNQKWVEEITSSIMNQQS